MAKESTVKTDKPQSRPIQKLEEHLKMTFPQIVQKYFKQGMSRYECTNIINALTSWRDPKQPRKPYFKYSTIWNAVKNGINAGEITDFDFGGRRVGNPRYSVKKKRKTPSGNIVRQNPNEIIAVEAHYRCQHCKHEQTEKVIINDPSCEMTMLRARQCPACHEYATSTVEFEFRGVRVRKAVIFDDGCRVEEFVDENLTKIPSPLQVSLPDPKTKGETLCPVSG